MHEELQATQITLDEAVVTEVNDRNEMNAAIEETNRKIAKMIQKNNELKVKIKELEGGSLQNSNI